MKILIVGSGGREHAICRALSRSEPEPELLIAPGNPGTSALGRNVDVKADDVAGLVELAKTEAVDMVVVGPELPLTLGLADALVEAGVACCGPSMAAAQLEGSKAFTRRLAADAGVPQPSFRVVGSVGELDEALESLGGLPVVKADGLAGGKGVYLPETREGIRSRARSLLQGSLGDAGRTVVLEERLTGTEASLFYAVDGEDLVLLPHAQDHKRLLEGDRGPNTGGMGAVSPNPHLDEKTVAVATDSIVRPVLRTLVEGGTPYRGFLYAGLMLTPAGPRLIEFNVRLGDPETQAILPRIPDGVFAELCKRTANGLLGGFSPDFDERSTCAIVVAADGYPGTPRKGDAISVEADVEDEDRWIDHAGTREGAAGLITSGGRVAAVVARARTLGEARKKAYDGVAGVHWNGMQFRRDVGGQEETRL